MSRGSSLPYQLRPNKAVDRELFLGLLVRLAATMNLERYQYIGLGGPFLEDFRLVHARVGISKLVCIEAEENVHRRQCFNRPVEYVECVHSTLEDYLDTTQLDEPVIIWFDYTDPGSITDQIERFARTVVDAPLGSLLRITLNANPTSLGTPDADEVAVEVPGMDSHNGDRKTVQEWRFERFKERLGSMVPSNLEPEGMTFKNYGKSVLHALHLAVEKELLSLDERRVLWCLSTHYADGQPMAAATLVVLGEQHTIDSLTKHLDGWGFLSTPTEPLLLDMPTLSSIERLTMESSADPRAKLGFELPMSDMSSDPFESFRKFYRFFPHFSRVDL